MKLDTAFFGTLKRSGENKMAWNRPSLTQIKDRIETDIESSLGLTSLVRRSFLKVMAKAYAGAVHLLHGFLEYMSRQIFADTAEVEFLDRHGAIWGVLRTPATFAELNIDITGTDGATIPVNTTYQSADGKEYSTDQEVTISGGVATVKIIATENGEESNLELSDVVSLESPIANVDSDATVSSIVIDAEDTEADEAYRARLLDYIRQPPNGGSANDYIQWALSVAGVTRAWVLPLQLGPGTVGVAIVEDGEDPITASPAKIQEVKDYIEIVRPVTAEVTVFTPILSSMDITIELKPNTTTVQEAVESEIKDLIFRDSEVEGSFKTPSEDNTGEILLSRINEAISIAQGEEDHNITLINGSAPADIIPGSNELIVLGTITWQPLP